jgi:Formyl transferase
VRLLNPHPTLLPRFGGRGMCGDRVFEAVLEAGEVESGVSIHLVDPEYDTGPIVNAKFRFSGMTRSPLSRPACGPARKSSCSKRLRQSLQVTFVSLRGQADLAAALFSYLAPSESADEKMGSLDFASWNQIGKWLRRVEALRDAA